MISLSYLYTDLTNLVPSTIGASPSDDEDLQTAQLNAYETGYQAGWDDAVKAKDEEGDKLTHDFVKCLQDMSFTYEDAYSKLSLGLKPVIIKLVTSVLPMAAQEGLHCRLLEQIEELVDAQSESILQLAVSPARRPLIEELLESQSSVPFAITEEPSLSDGQIYIRVNQQEREIDFDALLAEVTSAVNAFFFKSGKEKNYG